MAHIGFNKNLTNSMCSLDTKEFLSHFFGRS
jgi:hypothetical protein